MKKKWIRFLYVVALNLVTLPLLPIVFIVMTIWALLESIKMGDDLKDIIWTIIGTWCAMFNGIKWSIYANRIYINQNSTSGYDEFWKAVERQETEAP